MSKTQIAALDWNVTVPPWTWYLKRAESSYFRGSRIYEEWRELLGRELQVRYFRLTNGSIPNLLAEISS